MELGGQRRQQVAVREGDPDEGEGGSAMNLMLKTPLDTASGYGNDGVGLSRALAELGVNVSIIPNHVTPPIPIEVAELLTRKLDPPFDASIVHADPMSLSISPSARRVSLRVLGWTMWEFKEYRPVGMEAAYAQMKLRETLKDFDVLVCYDDVTREALEPHTPDSCALEVLQGGFWSDDWPYVDREWDGTFRYVMVGQLHSRKDPFAAVEAFAHLKRSKGDEFDAELHLKTTVPGLAPMLEDAYPGVKVHYRYWEPERIRQLYNQSHVLLAPSRGEGKNVPALEMQATGGVVIATNFGGHRYWLNPEYSYPLEYELEDLGDGMAARADRQHLADLMWHTYTHRDEVREKGRIASRVVRSMCDWRPVTQKLLDVVHRTETRNIATALG